MTKNNFDTTKSMLSKALLLVIIIIALAVIILNLVALFQ